jgi:hypothetical protein
MSNTPETKYYIFVTYALKDIAKSMGARWDPDVRRWYVLNNDNPLLETHQMIYLNIQYKDKDEAKVLDCQYDSNMKSWFCLPSNETAIRRFS